MADSHGIRWVAGQNTPNKVYITRVFNFGTWEEWQEIKRKYSPNEIEEAVRFPLRGCWTRRGRALAETLYDCTIPDEGLIAYNV